MSTTVEEATIMEGQMSTTVGQVEQISGTVGQAEQISTMERQVEQISTTVGQA